MNNSNNEISKAEKRILKAKRKLKKEQERNKKLNIVQSADDLKVNILCVRFGHKYSDVYVKKLRNMVSRNITVPYNFICLTDDPTPIDGVKLIVQENKGYVKGWWHKVHMFDPNLPIEGRILYFDLDVIIHKNIDNLVTYEKNKFVGIRDFNRKFHRTWRNLNSSVMAWNHRSQNHIWDQFTAKPSQAMRMHGDQDWIWKTSQDRIKFWPDEWIQSYKWEIRRREEIFVVGGKRNFRKVNNNVTPHSECCVAVFHGEPNPEDVQDKFVVDNWR